MGKKEQGIVILINTTPYFLLKHTSSPLFTKKRGQGEFKERNARDLKIFNREEAKERRRELRKSQTDAQTAVVEDIAEQTDGRI